MKTVKKTLVELPEISAARRDELLMLTDNSDHNVDLSDAPELTPAQLDSMQMGKF